MLGRCGSAHRGRADPGRVPGALLKLGAAATALTFATAACTSDDPIPTGASASTETPSPTAAPITSEPPRPADSPATNESPAATVTAQTTDAPSLESSAVVGALDFHRDGGALRNPSLFGYSALTEVDDRALLDDVSEELGEPDADTGWIPTPGALDCSGASEYRSLLWDDIRFVLVRYASSGATVLNAWSVGDVTLAFSPPLNAEITEPSGVATAAGIGLGTSVDQLEQIEWAQSLRQGDLFLGLAGIGPVQFQLDANDRVLAMSFEQNDC